MPVRVNLKNPDDLTVFNYYRQNSTSKYITAFSNTILGKLIIRLLGKVQACVFVALKVFKFRLPHSDFNISIIVLYLVTNGQPYQICGVWFAIYPKTDTSNLPTIFWWHYDFFLLSFLFLKTNDESHQTE